MTSLTLTRTLTLKPTSPVTNKEASSNITPGLVTWVRVRRVSVRARVTTVRVQARVRVGKVRVKWVRRGEVECGEGKGEEGHEQDFGGRYAEH